MKKALLVATVSGFIPQFEMNNVKILQQLSYEVHFASNYNLPSYGTDNHRLDGTGIIRHQIDFVRTPFSFKNRDAYGQLKTLMRTEHFDLVHCHTPMGGVIARLAAHATGTGPVVYTAHGFHFYRGAPWKNWLCYYPIEKWLSKYTDQQLCINKEDYERAKGFYAQRVNYIPGAGIDLGKISNATRKDIENKKKELGISPDAKVILSAGEFIKRKNHESIVRALAKILDKSLVYVICGHGKLEQYLTELVKQLNIEEKVLFTGYRSDVFEICQMANLYVFPSYQEGLPMALLEAMACGLPVVCSDIRGSRDLMDASIKEHIDSKWQWCDGGIIVKKANDVEAYADAIQEILANSKRMEDCGERNAIKAKEFSICCVDRHMRRIYKSLSTSDKEYP